MPDIAESVAAGLLSGFFGQAGRQNQQRQQRDERMNERRAWRDEQEAYARRLDTASREYDLERLDELGRRRAAGFEGADHAAYRLGQQRELEGAEGPIMQPPGTGQPERMQRHQQEMERLRGIMEKMQPRDRARVLRDFVTDSYIEGVGEVRNELETNIRSGMTYGWYVGASGEPDPGAIEAMNQTLEMLGEMEPPVSLEEAQLQFNQITKARDAELEVRRRLAVQVEEMQGMAQDIAWAEEEIGKVGGSSPQGRKINEAITKRQHGLLDEREFMEAVIEARYFQPREGSAPTGSRADRAAGAGGGTTGSSEGPMPVHPRYADDTPSGPSGGPTPDPGRSEGGAASSTPAPPPEDIAAKLKENGEELLERLERGLTDRVQVGQTFEELLGAGVTLADLPEDWQERIRAAASKGRGREDKARKAEEGEKKKRESPGYSARRMRGMRN